MTLPVFNVLPPTLERRPYTAVVVPQECIISRTHNIFVGSFDCMYLLTGHDPKTKYSFAAQLQLTEMEGISRIFAKLKELGVNLHDLKMEMMGGTRNSRSSMEYGDKIASQLEKEGLISQVSMRWRRSRVPDAESTELNIPIGKKYMYYGGYLNPSNGKFQFRQSLDEKIEKFRVNTLKKAKDTLNLFTGATSVFQSLGVEFVPLETPIYLLTILVV
jgi:hypothetical protein